MLVEIMIGDSYGAGFEFAKPERLVQLKNDLSTYYPHNLPGHLPAGSYTDDTQMSIAIAEHIVSDSPWTKEALAERFVATFKRDPRNGYSRKMQAILDSVSSGTEFLAAIVPNSDRCGAAMRSCPIGYFSSVPSVLSSARIQAKITHDTAEGIVSSQTIALASHYFLYNKGSKEDLFEFLDVITNFDLVFKDKSDLWPIKTRVTSEAIPCVKAALSAIVRNNSMSDILKECIDYTGDVDSIAAMALGLASCIKKDMKNDLPEKLYIGLENGKFGLQYIRELDKTLAEKYSI